MVSGTFIPFFVMARDDEGVPGRHGEGVRERRGLIGRAQQIALRDAVTKGAALVLCGHRADLPSGSAPWNLRAEKGQGAGLLEAACTTSATRMQLTAGTIPRVFWNPLERKSLDTSWGQ